MTRRISVAGSAVGRGFSPCSRCSTARKASIGLRTQLARGPSAAAGGTAGRVGDRNAQWSRGSGWLSLVGRRPGPLLDPRRDLGDLAGRERRAFALGRHAPAFPAGDRIHDQALVALTGHERRTAVSSLLHQGRRIQPQPGLVMQGAVASITPLAQDRLDLAGVVDRAHPAASPPGSHPDTKPAIRTKSPSRAVVMPSASLRPEQC